jgi:thymidylate synthase (FAD)
MKRRDYVEQSVKLVAITEGANELVGKSAQDIISYVARVSNPNNQMSFETGSKLIKYCITHEHWSIFEHSFATMEIKTSRAIAAQILRHRSFTFQEFSQRYAAASQNVVYPARRQDQKNRQNSVDDMSQDDRDWFTQAQNQMWDTSKALYDEALTRGVAKEQARFLLPLSTETTIYMSGSIRSWIHYIELRAGHGTQKEHMDIAKSCRSIIAERFPDVAMALEWDKE